jgi:hypothetical protein
MRNQFDPENLRVTAWVDAQRVEPGKRLVYDKARKDFVDPKDLPISRNPKFKYVQLPVEELGKLGVQTRDIPLLIILRLDELWFTGFKRNPVKLAAFEMGGIEVSRHTKARGLSALEAAGLILVERKPRKIPLVTLLWRSPLG